MTNTDPWGIDRGYFDVAHVWHETSDKTRAALRTAMGAADGQEAPEPSINVRVVTHGQAVEFDATGELVLEDGTRLAASNRLAADLPIGYHEFHTLDGARRTHVIVSPRRCVLPPAARAWGWASQLYAARSQQSWGMGDLADLERLGRWSASLGAGLLMLNPLYSAAPVLPQQPSPYYATTRRFLNAIYLRIEEVPGAADVAADIERLANMGHALLSERRIDRDAIFQLKQEALGLIWERRRGTRDVVFDHFRQERGETLRQFAIYCALAEKYGGDWRLWPADLHTHDTPAVAAWAIEQDDRVRYFEWLQYLLDLQLRRAASSIPLVQDLPIGFDPGGFDGWIWQEYLARGCTVGAPPDIYNAAGQNWGFPPLTPHKLRASGYRPLVETLRSAFRHAGGLRIDHAMGLFRLYWIPPLAGPAEGAFVRYRSDETLAVLAIESHRAGAYVVGEDLGTVEEGVREAMAEHHVLSTRVLWFEDKPPAEYPELAMVAVSTHDLPTIAGLWSGADFQAQRTIGLPASEEATREIRDRLVKLTAADERTSETEVIHRAYARLAEAPSRIVMAQLDDALAIRERPNMPGTLYEWPNWSIALEGGVEALEASPLANSIAAALGDSDKR